MRIVIIKIKDVSYQAQPDSPQAFVEPPKHLTCWLMEGLPSNEISDLTNWQMPVIRKSSSLGPEFQAFFLLFPDPILSIIDKLKNCMLRVQQDIGYQAPFGW